LHGSKPELNIEPSFRIYGNHYKMGMQQDSKMVLNESIREYLGLKGEAFRKALKTAGIDKSRKGCLLTEEEAETLCIKYSKQVSGVPFLRFSNPPSWGLTGLEPMESAVQAGTEPTQRERELSDRLESVKQEREEYRTLLAESEAKISDLSERLERSISDLSEAKRKAETMEASLSSASEKHQAYVLENAEKIAAANQFVGELQRTKAALSQADGTIATLSQDLEKIRAHYARSQKGWAGLTLNDGINGLSMLVFLWAAWSVLGALGLFGATLGAMYMARTVRNMKAALNEEARVFGFRVCFFIELVAGGMDFLGFYKAAVLLTWLPFPPWAVSIGAAVFVVVVSISALYTSKKENEF
jgi:hypothetical protein